MINEIQHILDVLDPIVITPLVTIIVSGLKRFKIDPHKALLVVSLFAASVFAFVQKMPWWEHVLVWGKEALYIAGVAILIYEVLVKRYFTPKA